MAFHYAHEAKKWREWKEQEETLLRRLHVDETIIQQLREYDWKMFNDERRYINHHILTNDNFLNEFPYYDRIEFCSITHLLDEIENEALFEYLSETDQVSLNIILLKILGYSTKDISEILRISSSAIYSRIARLKKTLKKFMESDEK